VGEKGTTRGGNQERRKRRDEKMSKGGKGKGEE
jgi:hypothetical protein